MIVLSISPNTGKYFIDRNNGVNISDTMYQGIYEYTPVYPRYTFRNNGRFNYSNENNTIEFYTMLPIVRFMTKAFIEIRYRYIINSGEPMSLNVAISEFNKVCEFNKHNLDISAIITEMSRNENN